MLTAGLTYHTEPLYSICWSITACIKLSGSLFKSTEPQRYSHYTSSSRPVSHNNVIAALFIPSQLVWKNIASFTIRLVISCFFRLLIIFTWEEEQETARLSVPLMEIYNSYHAFTNLHQWERRRQADIWRKAWWDMGGKNAGSELVRWRERQKARAGGEGEGEGARTVAS